MPFGWDSLSGTTGESVAREVPHEWSTLSGIAGEVSINKGEAVPPTACKATGDKEGS